MFSLGTPTIPMMVKFRVTTCCLLTESSYFLSFLSLLLSVYERGFRHTQSLGQTAFHKDERVTELEDSPERGMNMHIMEILTCRFSKRLGLNDREWHFFFLVAHFVLITFLKVVTKT